MFIAKMMKGMIETMTTITATGHYNNRGSNRPDDASDFRRTHANDDKNNADCSS